MSNQRAFNEQLMNAIRTLMSNQEIIIEAQSRMGETQNQMKADLEDLRQFLVLESQGSAVPVVVPDGDANPSPARDQATPFGTARPTAKHVRALIFKQLCPNCPRDAVQESSFDYREEHPELAATVDKLYLRIQHAADSAVAHLQSVVNPATSWSDVPKDLRVGAYLELENLTLSFGVDLRRCSDYWAAKSLVSTKWMNVHAYQGKKQRQDQHVLSILPLSAPEANEVNDSESSETTPSEQASLAELPPAIRRAPSNLNRRAVLRRRTNNAQ